MSVITAILHKTINPGKMKVAVWDTYVTKIDGSVSFVMWRN